MNSPGLSAFAALLAGFASQGCDPIVYARATTRLVAPVDSVCLKDALARRRGSPSLRPSLKKRKRREPAALWLYYGDASFTQTYPDSGAAALSAAQPIASGLAVLGRTRKTQDSVSRQLGRELLAVRDACGGRLPPDRPELEFVP